MIETKLLDILPLIELDDRGESQIVEERNGEKLTLLHLTTRVDDIQSSRSLVNCYDMGGHMQYYCAQTLFRNNHSIYFLTFERFHMEGSYINFIT